MALPLVLGLRVVFALVNSGLAADSLPSTTAGLGIVYLVYILDFKVG